MPKNAVNTSKYMCYVLYAALCDEVQSLQNRISSQVRSTGSTTVREAIGRWSSICGRAGKLARQHLANWGSWEFSRRCLENLRGSSWTCQRIAGHWLRCRGIDALCL
jgi:hypothetical protein